jgi:HK97 family phage major capsid protein
MKLTDQQRMNRMALQIPANYSRKDAGAGPTDMKGVRDEIMATITEYKNTATKLAADVATYGAVSSETKEMLEKIARRMDGLESQFNRPGLGDETPLSKTIAQLFVESEDFKRFQGRGWHKGGAGMKLKSIWEDAALPQVTGKTTITTSTVGTAGPQAMRVPLIEPQLRELRIRDLIPSTPTTQVVIEYPKENVFTNAASPQVEGSDKAEAALTFTLGTATVRTIAHWIPATRQVLDDMDMLMSYIQKRLRYGLNWSKRQKFYRAPVPVFTSTASSLRRRRMIRPGATQRTIRRSTSCRT